MNEIAFAKGHGTLNDFVLLTDADDHLRLTDAQVRALCHRRAGIGADGILRAVHATHVPGWAGNPDVWFMDYRNADGSVAETCGNGLRVFARYLVDQGLAPGPQVPIVTRAGLRSATLGEDGTIAVTMGVVRIGGKVTLTQGGHGYEATAVNVGNPHAVAFVPDGALDVMELAEAPAWTPQSSFPDGVNAEFVEIVAPGHLRMRVHERGVGETYSCGTGIVAAAAAHKAQAGHLPDEVRVDVPGGSLIVRFDGDEAVLVGPAVIVAYGRVDVNAAGAAL